MSASPPTPSSSFRGGVFHADLSGGRSGAELTLDAGAVLALTSEGRAFTFPFGDCAVELGGASGKMVFVRGGADGATAFTEERGFLEALEQASGGVLAQTVEAARDTARQKSRRNLRAGLVLAGIFAALLAALFVGVGWIARAAVDRLPISVDESLGEAAQGIVTAEGEVVDDPVLTGAIQAIVAALEPHAAVEGFTYDVHVVRSDVVNAFALPGGTIVVFTGLIEKATTPEQVAGVLAHEIAHVTLRHGLRRVARQAGVFLGLRIALGDAEGVVAIAASLADQATMLGHSRDQEREADAEGVRMLHAAGIDPEGLAEFFQLLEEEYGSSQVLTSWLSTHPEHDERTESVRALAGELEARQYAPFAETAGLDWEAIRAQAGG